MRRSRSSRRRTPRRRSDAAAFDSVPGSGFDTSPMAAAIVPPKASLTGTGAHLSINPAETNAFRAINAAWKANATVSRAGDRYVISGLSDAAHGRAGRRRLRSPASASPRPDADPEAAHRAVRAAEQHGRRLDEMGARALRLRVRQPQHAGHHRHAEAIASTCSSSATSGAACSPAAASAGRPRAAIGGR